MRRGLKLAAIAAATLPLLLLGLPVHGSVSDDVSDTSVQQAADRVLSGDESFPDGFTVPAGEVWEFDPTQTTTVESGANVVVEGVLRMKPASRAISHTLRFVGVDESKFVGGGTDVLDTDVGLWVMGAGQVDIVGSKRAGWNRTGTDPTWRANDDIRVAPNAVGDTSGFGPFEPGSSVPKVSYAGKTYSTEVFNLSRNVVIEGTGDGEADPANNGRAHIFIGSSKPQTIRYAELRHLGPRQVSDENPTESVLGRYALHFHMMGDGSRGSLVEGVVVRDTGGHAFVPHMSHGITFRDTISFNTFDEAYWWDADDETYDVRYEHAMAAYTRFDPEYRGYGLNGFQLGTGKNMTVTDSVAVGIQGNVDSSGFHWPEFANGDNNSWTFENNVSHNNNADGIFVWQNDQNDHLAQGFVGYRNGGFGVDQGAYVNNYHYRDLVLFENGEGGIQSKAVGSSRQLPQLWTNVDTESITISEHILDSDGPIVFDGLTLRGGKISVNEDPGAAAGVYEFRNTRTADGLELTREDFEVNSKTSTITVYRSDGSSFEI